MNKEIKKLTKSERQKRLSQWILIILLAAGLVSLLGGSYLTLFYTSRKTNPTATPQNTTTTPSQTSTATTTKEEAPQLARLDVILANRLSLSYPLAWQNEPQGVWLKILNPLNDYSPKSLLRLADASAKINISINSYLLPSELSLSQFSEKFNEALKANGFEIKFEKPTLSGSVLLDDLTFSKDNLSYRAYYKVIFDTIKDNKRPAYVIMAASLEKDWLDNLSELSYLLNSARLK